MAIRKGLEPSTSSVTGWHSKPTELPDRIWDAGYEMWEMIYNVGILKEFLRFSHFPLLISRFSFGGRNKT